MFNVNNRWYLRDSNWFADFSFSAKKISQMYVKEGGSEPDAIIAVTPTVLSSLLSVTGPISVPNYKITLTADNFVEQTQAISTISNNSPLNQPKQVLADFFPLFIQKLQTLSSDQYKQLVIVLINQMQQKQIALYARDPSVQQKLSGFDWAGTVFNTDRDYLEVVSANLGGTKTDLALQKKIDIQTTIQNDGSLTNSVTLTVSNTEPKIAGTQNVSFIRFLVPRGSTLLSVSGFETKDLTNAKKTGYSNDPDVTAWQTQTPSVISTSTEIGIESGKTYFGNWLTVMGGETKTIKLNYRLPFTLSQPDRLSLTLQKQIGSVQEKFNYSVHFDQKKLQWESFTPSKQDKNSVSVEGELDKDHFFGFVF